MKHLKLWIGVSALILVLSFSGTYFFLRSNKYSWVHPKRGPLVEAVYGLGKVRPERKYEVKLAIMTNVNRLYVKEGDEVEKNAPLIQFNNTAIFRAPFAGLVTQVTYNEAETALPQTVALRLEEIADMYIEVSLEQEGALRVKKGLEAYVIFESLRGERFSGEVSALYPKDDEFLAHIKVDGLPKNVLPGMTADTSIVISKQENVLMVPISAVMNGQLTLKKDSRKVKIPVKLGGVNGQWAEIIEGDITIDDEVLIKKE